MQVRYKRPGEKKTFHFLWEDELDGDTISTKAVTVETGLTEEAESVNGSPITIRGVEYAANTVVSVQVSGGTLGEKYTVTCDIVTAAGDELEAAFECKIVSSYDA